MADSTQGSDWGEIDAAIDAAKADAKQIDPSYRHTLLPDGEIVLASLKDVIVGNVGGAWRWLATFTISFEMAEWQGLPVLRSYNIPGRGWVSPQHSLAIDWRNVTGIPMLPLPKPPTAKAGKKLSREEWKRLETRRARLYLGSFLRDVQVELRTRVVNKQMDREAGRWVETKPGDWYSVADRILSCAAGVPRVLERRRPF